ncbi:MAG: hypothetical protein CL878_14980 [Dehalococcoidia bacterium]|nr:hypothetical protein [Dehalococcoidia bacterium]
MEIIALESPLPADLIKELAELWESTFETSYDDLRLVLAGDEVSFNRNLVYLIREGKELAGTTHLTIPREAPALGGLGEVVTVPTFRGRGIATRLCARARDDFRAHSGRALYLGTVNPAAARVYHRLGWRNLAGTTVMACATDGPSPEAFLVDYFREQGGGIKIAEGTAASRIPMIPLIVMPHDWQVLDANVALYSTRHVAQHSCMSLYPRFHALTQQGRGAWFGAQSIGGGLLGLGTARLDAGGQCQVDGFVYQAGQAVWSELLQAAASWGVAHGATACWTAVSVEDEQKKAWSVALGFSESGQAEDFALGDRSVASVRLERRSDDSSA